MEIGRIDDKAAKEALAKIRKTEGDEPVTPETERQLSPLSSPREYNNMSNDTSVQAIEIDLKTILGLVLGTPVAMIGLAVLITPQHKTIGSVVGLILGLALGFLLWVVLEQRNRELAAQDVAQEQTEKIKAKIGEKQATTVDIAVLNMSKLDEYYTLNKQQAQRSFNISVTAVVVGFATLIFTVRFVNDQGSKFAGGLAGVLLQFIGGGFFYLYNKSLEQLNRFYEKLITLQNTMLALQLCETLNESKEETTKTIALELMKRPEVMTGTTQAKTVKRAKHTKTPPLPDASDVLGTEALHLSAAASKK